jgi:hypothetical protein
VSYPFISIAINPFSSNNAFYVESYDGSQVGTYYIRFIGAVLDGWTVV